MPSSRRLKYISALLVLLEYNWQSDFKLNRVISPETKYIHLMEVIQEAELKFLLASLKGETFHVFGNSQSKISNKR